MNSMKSRNVLLIGGTGSWAYGVIQELLVRGVSKIRIFARNEYRMVKTLQKFQGSCVEGVIGDIRDTQAVKNAMKDCQIVFELAALKHVPICEAMPVEAIETNIIGTKNVCVSTGKLRRYFSKENFKDVFRVVKGFRDAVKILKTEKPQLVYAGGGYVVVPVVWAARLLRIPVLLRETDYTVGLANRLCLRFVREVFVTFPDTQKQITHALSSFPGMIIRPELYDTYEKKDLQLPVDRPVCLALGGSLGDRKINQAVWAGLEDLTRRFTVVHICGKTNRNSQIPDSERYHQIEFTSEIGQYLAVADVVVTRCGSNATAECLSLDKHMVCIPITSKSSRGEQEQNAAFAVENGNAVLLPEAELNTENLLNKIDEAMLKNVLCPYAATQKEMYLRIQNHIAHIYHQASEQLKRI